VPSPTVEGVQSQNAVNDFYKGDAMQPQIPIESLTNEEYSRKLEEVFEGSPAIKHPLTHKEPKDAD